MPPLCESSLPAIESELQLLGNPPLGESPSTRTGINCHGRQGRLNVACLQQNRLKARIVQPIVKPLRQRTGL